MDGRARPPNRGFSVSPVDRLGRPISPVVLNAAEEIGRRAIEHAEKLLIDPAVAAGLLEEAAATVSRALTSKKHCAQSDVRDLPSYLFRAFIRRVDRIKKKQLTQVDDVPVPTFGSRNSTDPQAAVEMKILVDELLTRCDAVTREMFYRRIQGFSWEEIGRSYGISDHAARSRFSQALRRIGEKLGLKSDL
jgi:DNA-directed RNA polymerase specialized sigma24 family protein